jgi:3-hydroxyisobutyrate dehydrogenase
MAEHVGLIGVGAMGSALLERLRAHGYSVAAYDISETGGANATRDGATIAESPAQAARLANYVHVFVNTDSQVLDVTLGELGIFSSIAPGALVLLHSTILPATTLRVAEAAATLGVAVVDAPITAVPRRIRAGEGIVLLGGEPEVAAKARSHLETMGFDVRHFGRLGSGNAAKLAKNFANAAERLVLTAAVALAETSGLDPRQFLEMVRSAEQNSLISRWDHIFAIENGHSAARPVTNLYNKDLGQAAELAKMLALDSPLFEAAAEDGRRMVEGWKRARKEAGG